MASIYQTGVDIGPTSRGFLSGLFGDSVDITFASLSGFVTALLLYWVLGIGMRDSVQCGLVSIGSIFISKSIFDSFFQDAKIAITHEKLRPNYDD